MAEVNTIQILNIPIYNKNIGICSQHILDKCSYPLLENLCMSATGAHGLVYAQSNTNFFSILSRFYLNLPDGTPSVWVGKLKGAKKMKRCYGPDFFRTILTNTKDLPIRHFFCGGNEGVAEELKIMCQQKFENFNICGTYCPPFLATDQYNYEEIAEKINTTNASIVWIGLSTPKQEVFAYNLSKYTDVHFIICVGAAFDFHTDKVKQAPKLIQKIGMEWFFRLCMEPKRLFKRYIEIVPKFIYFNILDFTGNLKPNK